MTRSDGWSKADPAKLIEATEQLLSDAKRDYGIAQKVVEMPPSDSGLRDMPESVLDGRLGEICASRMVDFPRAYAWPALLAVASSLIDQRHSAVRTNLYVALVGPVHSGKTQAIQHAVKILGIESPVHMDLLSGSAEQLIRKAKDAVGNPRLFSPDELGHLFEKMRIQGASFPYVLNKAFYSDKFEVLMAHRESATFDCVLSILGGMVEDRFHDLFNAGTTGGLYDRFLFGLCPSNYFYDYSPFEGPRETTFPVSPSIDDTVWGTKSKWIAEEHALNPRIVEIAIRAATVCAAFDGRKVLYGANLGPARELVRYQARIRRVLKPNPGENFEARLAHKFLDYLDRQNGRFVSSRKMFRDTRAYDLGPSIANRALTILSANGEIEIAKNGRQEIVRRILETDDTKVEAPE